MKQLTISITEEQEKFLKLFAEKQYHGAPDNRCTGYPLHMVQTKRYEYIPYSEDIVDYYMDLPLTFTTDSDYECWFDTKTETIEDWYECKGEDCSIDIKPFSEVYGNDIVGVNDKEHFIVDYDSYFKAYDVELVAMAWKKEYWEDVAPFFILEEAKKYMKYQSHNLKSPRTYTYSSGYANYGEFEHFWELLMKAGTQLNSI